MRKLVSLSAILSVILISAAAAVIIFKISIPVSGLAKSVAAIASIAADRDISITGKYYAIPGKWLHLTCDDGHITVDQPNLKISAEIGHLSTQLHLWSLLRKEVLLDHISLDTLRIDLVTSPPRINGSPPDTQDTPIAFSRYPDFLVQTGDVDCRNIELSIIKDEDPFPLVFKADSITGFAGRKQPGHLKIAGQLQRQKLAASIAFDPLHNLAAPNTVFNYSAEIGYADADLNLKGRLAENDRVYTLDSDFRISNLQLSTLDSLLAYDPPNDASISCKGQCSISPDNLKLELNSFSPGTKNLAASITLEKIDSGFPSVTTRISAEFLDLDKILAIAGFRKQDKPPRGTNQESENTIILPESLAGTSFDLSLNVKKIVLGGKEISGLNTHSVMNNGVIRDAPFTAGLDKLSFQGMYSLDSASEPPGLQVLFSTNSWDLGATLTEAGLTEDLDLSVNKTQSSIKTSGRSITELVSNLDFTINASDGVLKLPDHNTKAELPVVIESFTLKGEPGEKITLQFLGRVNDEKISATGEIEDKRTVSQDEIDSIPFLITVERDDTRLSLAGMLPVPFNFVGTTINYKLSGSDTGSLEDILNIKIPYSGDYQVKGSLHVTPEGYRVSDLKMAIGESVLQGELDLGTKIQPPRLNLDLQAETIQLSDFKQHPAAQVNEASPQNHDFNTSVKERKRISDWSVPDSFNADVTLRIEELLSGKDYIGSGLLHAELNNGRLTLKPIQIHLSAGEIVAEFSMDSEGNDQHYFTKIDISDLDYGILSRWLKPGTDQGGILNLRSALTTRVHGQEAFLKQATGYVDFCLQPENFRTGIVDLWAINLLSYLLPIFMPSSDSQLNCIAGRFNINDGKMKQEDLLLDTSRIQVKGNMEVDFARGWIESRLRPVPKRPQFYSLATPLQISGKLDDLNVGVARGGLIGTMIRILTSYVIVPVQWAVLKKIPVDATEHCINLYNQRDLDEYTESVKHSD